MEYNHLEIEKKWQKKWEDEKTFKTEESSKKPKFYCLDMFPYPSGSGLHVGHPRGYSASDVFSRYKRMRGFNVLHPMGWDAFGLPAENYALKTGIHPEKSTKENIERFKKQIKSLSFSYDWSKEINTTDPSYYKWTQWIFLKLFEKGLAYEAVLPINWCPSCKTGLANEEVVGNECDRCGTQVERKNLRQWVLKITSYAERLLEDLDSLDWPEKIKEMQKNWIGKSEGADIVFTIEDEKQEYKKEIKIFTTRPDTLFGATALVLSPEHPFVVENQDKFVDSKKIKDYLKKSLNKSDLERTDLAKEKTGIEITDFKAINPVTKEKISIWIADYVLISYGYGAVMSVPAHDERDYDFAKKFNLEIKEVVSGGDVSKEAYIGEGVLVNSKEFNGVYSLEARKKITESLQKNKLAEPAINYKLRDWVFSRQRYWGEPIPLIHCESCGVVPVPENNLPVELPKVDQYQPTGTGESPLAALEDWVNVSCPKCGSVAKRETNTMPQWAGSCWYYLRYIDTENKNELVDLNKEKEFMPVDLYIGGAEHAVLHLLYARFWHKFLYDINRVSTKEPFLKLKNQGLILAEDGQKMSKSKGNVVSPDELIHQYGADSLRIYEMFMGPFEEPVAWNNKGLVGARRFLEKIFRVEIKDDLAESKLLHKTIKKVTEDIESFKFNTAVSSLMILINEWSKTGASTKDFNIFLKMLSCFAPCVAEELWEKNGNKKSVCLESWPSFNPSLIEEETVVLIVQINGKVRDKISLQAGLSLNEVKEIVLEREKVKEWMKGNKTKDIIFVQDKLINIVF